MIEKIYWTIGPFTGSIARRKAAIRAEAENRKAALKPEGSPFADGRIYPFDDI
jgi:hypothetical protein